MTKQIQKKYKRKKSKQSTGLPFTKGNYYLFGVGLLTLILGYISLSIGPWNSFWSLSLAPVLLVLGYCVVIPVAILYRKKIKPQEDDTHLSENEPTMRS